MYSLNIEFQTAPLSVKIKEMHNQLEFLKSLDDALLFGPWVLQMDGDIGESSGNPSQGLVLHQPAAAHPPPPPGRGLHTKIAQQEHSNAKGKANRSWTVHRPMRRRSRFHPCLPPLPEVHIKEDLQTASICKNIGISRFGRCAKAKGRWGTTR